MGSCCDCGIDIPDGQTSCSMCYGDIEHGSDGYYRDWAERQLEDQRQREQEEAAHEQYVQEQIAQEQMEQEQNEQLP